MRSRNFVTATTTTDWRQRFQRGFVDQRTKNRGIHTDVLMNWETVKYFTAEQHESNRYTKAVKIASGFYFWLYGPFSTLPTSSLRTLMRLHVVWFLSTAAWDIIQLGQTFIMISGLLLGSVIVSRSILHHRSSPGDFIVRSPSSSALTLGPTLTIDAPDVFCVLDRCSSRTLASSPVPWTA